MAEGLVWLVCFIVGHVFGSIPCGLWLVKAAHGIDIREYGSKNIGTTNVFRTVGGKTAFFVLLCDMMKGILAVALVAYFTNNAMGGMVAAGIGALLGHNYSIFLGFKGGRGVATGLGLILYFMPKVCIASFGGVCCSCHLHTDFCLLFWLLSAVSNFCCRSRRICCYTSCRKY